MSERDELRGQADALRHSTLVARCGGDAELANEIAHLALAELGRLRSALVRPGERERTVHALRGLARTLGASDLDTTICGAWESGDLAGITQAIDRTLAALEAIAALTVPDDRAKSAS